MTLSLPAGVTLYFARHGETQANSTGHLQGHTKDTALTPKGEAQAQAIGKTLRKHVPTPLDWVSSPLPRARRTMELARVAYGLPPDGYRIDPRLIEINMGNWEGLTHGEVEARFPAEYAARGKDKWNWRGSDGFESYSDVAARAAAFVGDLKSDTFAMTHGAFTRILRGVLAGLDWHGIAALGEPQGCVFRARDGKVERLDD